MTEYIEREAAIVVLCDACGNAACPKGLIPQCSYYEKMQSIPAADVRPVVKAHWYWDKDGMDWGIGAWRCDNCKSKAETWWASDKKYNPLRCSGGKFCGNCGADMREES